MAWWIGKLSDDLKKEVWRRLEAEEARGNHKGVRTRGWRASARLQATRARLVSDSESGSESESEPSECDSEEDTYRWVSCCSGMRGEGRKR